MSGKYWVAAIRMRSRTVVPQAGSETSSKLRNLPLPRAWRRSCELEAVMVGSEPLSAKLEKSTGAGARPLATRCYFKIIYDLNELV